MLEKKGLIKQKRNFFCLQEYFPFYGNKETNVCVLITIQISYQDLKFFKTQYDSKNVKKRKITASLELFISIRHPIILQNQTESELKKNKRI